MRRYDVFIFAIISSAVTAADATLAEFD